MVQEERNSRGIIQRMDEIETQLKNKDNKKEKKESGFKLPLKVKSGSKSKPKKNKVVILKIMTNGNIDFRWEQILPNGMIYLKENGTYHRATSTDVLRYNHIPYIILPEWSLKPFSPAEHYEKTEKEKMLASPQRVIIDAIKQSQIKSKGLGGLNAKTAFILIIGAVIAIAFLASAFGG